MTRQQMALHTAARRRGKGSDPFTREREYPYSCTPHHSNSTSDYLGVDGTKITEKQSDGPTADATMCLVVRGSHPLGCFHGARYSAELSVWHRAGEWGTRLAIPIESHLQMTEQSMGAIRRQSVDSWIGEESRTFQRDTQVKEAHG